jgi:hypothetical protein
MARATCRTTVLSPGGGAARREIARRCEVEPATAKAAKTKAALLTAALDAARSSGSWVAHAGGARLAVIAPAPAKPKLFVGILSAPNNFLERSAVRNTWLRLVADSAHAFIVGLPFGDAQDSENKTFGDLALVEGLDHYRKFSSFLPVKAYTTLWLALRCGAAFTLKTDDDSFVHVPRLLSKLPLRAAGFYGGFILNHNVLKYCQGGGYVFSTEQVPCLLKNAAAHWDMPREDVFAGLAVRRSVRRSVRPCSFAFWKTIRRATAA